MAGSKANGVFTAEMTHSAALEHYSLLKRYAVEAGRPSDAVRVLPGFALVVASTEKEAIERYDELESKGPENYTEYRLSGILGVDVTTLELDEPLPEWITPVPEDPAAFSGSLAFREATVTFAREGRLTVRQLLRSYGGYGHPIIIGTPEQVVDTLVDWFESRAADGFNLMPDVFPDGLETLVDHVLPILRKRGYFSSDYERKRTLRERLSPARIVR